jgi:hypothetical protein
MKRLIHLEAAVERLYSAQPLTHSLPFAVVFLKISLQASKNRPNMALAKNAYQASCLAGWQSEEVLIELLEHYLSEECYFDFFCYLLHEMVLRGSHVERVLGLKKFKEKMRERRHPLAWLPLSLADIEHQIDFMYNRQPESSECLAFGPILIEDSAAHIVLEHDMREVTTDREKEKLQTVINNWEEQSNGRSEARVFATCKPSTLIELSPKLLLSLKLECLKGVGEDDFVIQSSSLQQIFRILYEASSNGGAYGRGRGGALGRLDAWCSITALAGAKEEASFERVVEWAKRCTWFTFKTSDTKSQWFEHIAWDVGVIAIRPDRYTVAILAATDSD